MIQPTLFLGLPAHVRLDQIEITSHTRTLSLAGETTEAACPLCQQVSHRVHRHDTRTLADLPGVGKALPLLVLVRRFFGQNEGCPRKRFAERLPERTRVSARRTPRETEALAELGVALGGQAAGSLGASPGLPGSRRTLVRSRRNTPVPPVPTPRMLGIEAWASRRGKKDGTLLIE